MQPLYSVDHETRQNSNRREDEDSEHALRENTPLLHRFPQTEIVERNTATTAIVAALVIILVLGVVIGIYLLIIQNNSENILPPVETPLQLVPQSQWDPAYVTRLTMAPMEADRIIAVQTDTPECYSTDACSDLLRNMQNKTSQLEYNFLLSSNGQTYEALGWHRPSPMFPEYPRAMVLAFIGNFTDSDPTKKQKDEAQNFISESISQRHLVLQYEIIAKTTSLKPNGLFHFLRTLPQWNEEASD